MRPLMLQTRNFKREVTNDDLNKSDFKKFEGQPDIFGKELFFQNMEILCMMNL